MRLSPIALRKHLLFVLAILVLAIAPSAFAQPANDTCSGAPELIPSDQGFPYTTPVLTSLSAATPIDTSTTSEQGFSCGLSTRRVWYKFIPSQTAVYRFTTCNVAGVTGSTNIAILDGTTGCGSTLPELPGACSGAIFGSAPYPACSGRAATQALLTSGQTYYILVGRSGSQVASTTDAVGLTVDNLGQPPANDTCSGAITLPAGGFPVQTSVDLLSALTVGDNTMSCASNATRGVWYAFTPSQTTTYRFDTCAANGAQTSLPDTALNIYTSAAGCSGPFTAILGGAACFDNAASGSACGNQATSVAELIAGTTYYVQLSQGNKYLDIPNQTSVQLVVSTVSPPANDVCTAATPVTVNQPIAGTLDGALMDHELDGGLSNFSGMTNTATSATGRDVTYSFTAPADGLYTFRLTQAPLVGSTAPNMVLYLSTANNCSTATTLVPQVYGGANRNARAAEAIQCIPLTRGTQLISYVDETTYTSLPGMFEFEVSTCSPETEPNDIPGQPSATLSCGLEGTIVGSTLTGTNIADRDYFDLGSPDAGSRIFAMIDTLPNAQDGMFLRVVQPTGADAGFTVQAANQTNDTPWGGGGGNLGGVVAPGGNVQLSVTGATAATNYDSYRLYYTVQPPSTDALAETEPNDTAVTASAGKLNYFRGDFDGGTDVDTFAFNAKKEDVVFVEVDSNPDRALGAPSNFPTISIALMDSAGNTLIQGARSGSNSLGGVTDLAGTQPKSPSQALRYRIRADGIYYAKLTATGTTKYLVSIGVNCAAGNGIEAPTSVGSLSSAVGPTSGGTQVTIAGAGISSAARVRFNGVYATNVIWNGSGSITATTPPNTPGNALVEVVNPGNQATASANSFLYIPPPLVLSVSPATVSTTGGAELTVAGTDFVGSPITVAIDGAPVGPVQVDSPTQLRVTAPAHAAGSVAITVTTPFGSGTKSDAFRYLAPPQISSISPQSGPTAGGNTITINGQDFDPTATVKLGGMTATPTATGSSTQLFVTAPAASAGAVDVQVVNADGQQQTIAGGYTYLAPPVATSINPSVGVTSGGEPFTITGSNIDGAAQVLFGSDPATLCSVNGGTSISCSTPGHGAGAVDVTLVNADGQSATLPGAFTFLAAYPAPSLSGIAPNSGTTHGGQSVALTGADFRAGAQVFFGSTPATNVVVDVANQTVTCTTPPHAFGATDVTLKNADSQSATLSGGYTFIAPTPTLAAGPVSPSSGRTSGGTAITITGDELLSGATVDLGGSPCVNVNRVDQQHLTCTTTSHAAGFAMLTVTNPDGKSVTQAAAFNFVPPPTIASIAPQRGPANGGTVVVITGTNFSNPATVEFGGVAATSVTVNGPTQITCTTAAHSAAVVDVMVTNSDLQTATLTGGFTYDGPPTLASLSPSSGRTSGGTTIAISGNFFRQGARVFFTVGGNAVEAASVTVNSAQSLTVVTPAQLAGAANVTVRNVDNQSATLTGAFTFVPPPSLISVTPATGLTTGNTLITLTGTGFGTTGGVSVKFGATAGTSVAVQSSTTLTVRAPASVSAGAVDVTVTNADGQSVIAQGAYTYVWPAPTIANIVPNSGPSVGGTPFILNGTGFVAGVTVTIGGAPAGAVTRVNANQLTGVSPAGASGARDVVLTNPDGQSVTLTNGFTYIDAPVITSVTPSSGPVSGGTQLTITGSNFRPGAMVRVGGTAAFAVSQSGSTTISATTTSHAAGLVDVQVVNDDGQVGTRADAFTYVAPPSIASLAPSFGPTTGGTVVTVTGSGFSAGAQVTFGSAAGTNVTVNSATELIVTTPAQAAGVVAVTVINADGQAITRPGAFRYGAPPVLTSIDPASGDVAGGATVTLTGSGFVQGSTVTFGGAPAEVSFGGASTLNAVAPAHAAGKVDVVVTNPDGSESTLSAAFEYTKAAPTLERVTPATGSVNGGTAITLLGSGFRAGAMVTIGGVPATSVSVASGTLLRAVTPAHEAGLVEITITNEDGQRATLLAAFTYAPDSTIGEGTNTDGGTGGVHDPDPTPKGCGCNSVDVPGVALIALALGQLVRNRRRRS